MIFLTKYHQPFLPSSDSRASSVLLQWSSSSLWDALFWLGATVWLSQICFWGPRTALCWDVHASPAWPSVHRHSVRAMWRGCQQPGWEQQVLCTQQGQKLKSTGNCSVTGAGRVRQRFKTHPLPLPKLRLIYSLKTMGLSSPLYALWFFAMMD